MFLGYHFDVTADRKLYVLQHIYFAYVTYGHVPNLASDSFLNLALCAVYSLEDVKTDLNNIKY